MPAVTTEGLILKRSNFGEADRILTVLTDRYGKISIIAKGVRKITSRRAGNIELLNRVKLHLFKTKNYSLSEAESLETFSSLKENLTLSTTAFHIIELVDRLIPEGQKNPQVYDLVVSVLQILEKNPRQVYVRAFEVKLLAILGFVTFYDSTLGVEARKKYPVTKEFDTIAPEIRDLLGRLEKDSWNEIARMNINQHQALALERLLRYYIERTLESKLRSIRVMEELNG